LLDVSVSRVWLSRLTALGNSNGLSQTDCPESGWGGVAILLSSYYY
jgi:hypothetical protein